MLHTLALQPLVFTFFYGDLVAPMLILLCSNANFTLLTNTLI